MRRDRYGRSRARRMMLVGGEFTPLSISGLDFWVDASDLSTLYTDSAKTTGAGDTDVIGAWADKSTSGFDVLQVTTSKKPTLQLGVQNGLPVVRFAGTDDVLTAGDVLDLGTASMSLYVVAKNDGTTGGYAVKSFFGANDGRYGLAYLPAGELLATYENLIANQPANVVRAPGNFEIAAQILKRDGDANRLRVNGAEVAVTAFADDTASNWNTAFQWVIGNYGATGSDVPLTGDVGEVVRYNRALSSSEQLQLETYFSAKWGVSL